MNKTIRNICAILAFSSMARLASAEAAKVFFVSPKNHATVGQTFTAQFGVKGWAIKPAGTMESHTGHHHLIIDGEAIEKGKIVPADATHLHFGKGQTQTELHLSPGKHKLTLQFADGAHLSYGPEMSSTITITVK